MALNFLVFTERPDISGIHMFSAEARMRKNGAAVLKLMKDLFGKSTLSHLYITGIQVKNCLDIYRKMIRIHVAEQEQIGFTFQNHGKRNHCKGKS